MHSNSQSSNYEPLILSTRAMIDAYWPVASGMIEECLEVAGSDSTVETVYNRLVNGQAFMLVVTKDSDVRLALVFEINAEHRSLIIQAVAGETLLLFADQFWKHFCGWAYISGVRRFEGLVSPAVERIVSKLGFERPKSFVHVQMELPELVDG